MRRFIILPALAVGLGLIVWAFVPKPVEVELAEVAPRTIEVTVPAAAGTASATGSVVIRNTGSR